MGEERGVTLMSEVRMLAATGMLGTGFSESSFQRALDAGIDFIGCDAGSTDPGPYYLGSGLCQSSRAAYKRDLRIMLRAAVSRGIPLLIGSAGTAGGNPHLDWTRDIVLEIAREEGLHFKLGLVRTELSKEFLRQKLRQGKIRPLSPAPSFDEQTIDRATRFVGMMGPEGYQAALDQGAQVVLAGRSSDTSIYAAIPLQRGFPKGLIWHAAKIVECGAASTVQRLYPDCMVAVVRDDHFVVEPPNPEMRCSPLSVVSHTLYENDDPYHLYEPSGMLDTSRAKYEPYGDRGVLVRGSEYVEGETYTVRIEGAEKIGHRYVAMAGVRDPVVIRQIDSFLATLKDRIQQKSSTSLGLNAPDDYLLQFRIYGKDGTMGALEPENRPEGHELCVVTEVIAPTPEDARAILAIAWHTGLHHPVPEWQGLISNFAFPFSPPEMDAGPAFRFNVNHLVELDNPLEPFSVEVQTVGD